VLDEPVSSLDVSIRAEIMNLLKLIQQEHAISYLLISHNLATVRFLAHRVGVMYLGRIVEEAPSEELFEAARHPYSVGLISASTPAWNDPTGSSGRVVLAGEPPSAINVPSGCRFHPRCWLREQLGRPANCETDDPPRTEVTPGHVVACHWAHRVTPESITAAATHVIPVPA
jgi:oligopeptide/dipeptide ABC transporter ATP-binding protein